MLWQTEQVRASKYGVLKRGSVTGNSNYSVGLRQDGKFIYTLYMVDTNGCRVYPENPGEGMMTDNPNIALIMQKQGICDDQIAWLWDTANAILEKQERLNNEKGKMAEKQRIVDIRLAKNNSAYNGAKKKKCEIEEISNKWSWVKSLSDTANGALSGKEKIMLETYVQMTYFQRIIARANVRLLAMTEGQYELRHRREVDNFRNQSGLELDVVDHYNGSERNVKTLSGGESFKAALALALGLSEEIQSSSGGVKLDTMFVDEGFGSLDEESLRQAMNSLRSLSDGNRLVGIISHVGELKDCIEKQIIVTKGRGEGSSVKIVL